MSITDYTAYAATYDQRPTYAPEAISKALTVTGVQAGDRACDVGAGTGRVTRLLAEHGLHVDAVEPTPAMYDLGVANTAGLPGVSWHHGEAQDTGRPSQIYQLVTYGSSFNVITRQDLALIETARILATGGWILCCWHHFDLEDPLQATIDALIRERVPSWKSGIVGTDPTPQIDASGLYGPAQHIAVDTVHTGDTDTWLKAWRSHWTLRDAAGDAFTSIVADIDELVRRDTGDQIRVPYVTRVWVAQAQPAGSRP